MVNDKLEKVRSEIEKAYNEAQNRVKLVKDEYWEGKVDAYRNVLCIFDSMQEEPASDDLEQAIDTYLATYFGGEKEKQDWPFLKKMAIYFAKWQKQQDQSTIELAEDHAMLAGMEKMKEEMMAKAVDATVHIDAGGYPYIAVELYDYEKDIPLAKEGDKYKVILIKED